MKNIREDLSLSYDDVLLYPQKGRVNSRTDVDLTSRITKTRWIDVPVVSAPMSSVTEGEMALAMHQCDGFGIIHRFMDVEQQILNFQKVIDNYSVHSLSRCAVAVGIGAGSYERINTLYDAGVQIFCIDIAHAHCRKLQDWWTGLDLKVKNGHNVEFIMGNVATVEGARFLRDLGAAAIKVGIGPGAACTTRTVTGFGVPQLSAIMAIYDDIEDSVPIIADGGIKNSGDAAKAIAAGASTVMLGRLLAGADEAPHPGEYFGMASKRVNNHRAPEGEEGVVEKTGPVEDTVKTMAWGLRSAVSYAGCQTLDEFRTHAEFVRVSPMTAIETGTRI